MRLVLLGSPASGKGTQGALLATRYRVLHVSSGDLLRQEVVDATAIGRRVARSLAHGDLVSDAVVFELVAGALHDQRHRDGYILDGFPRTLSQARRAASSEPPSGIAVDVVVHHELPDPVARRRIAARVGDGRDDDADAAATERRLQVHHREMPTVLEFYEARGMLHRVDADQDIEQVTCDVLSFLERRGAPARAVRPDSASSKPRSI